MELQKIFNYKELVDKGNTFGHNVIIEAGTSVGCNNLFHDNCVIKRGCSIGNNNVFETGSVIGELPREYITGSYKKKTILTCPKVIIGNNNLFEAYSVIQGALETKTVIGNRVCIGTHSYIAHDVNLCDNVIVCSHCTVAGYCIILEYCNIGMGSRIHQRVVVGAFSMIGAGAVVVKHIAPASVVIGVPAAFLRGNYLGLERSGISKEEIDKTEEWLRGGCVQKCIPKYMVKHYDRFKEKIALWGDNKKIIPFR